MSKQIRLYLTGNNKMHQEETHENSRSPCNVTMEGRAQIKKKDLN